MEEERYNTPLIKCISPNNVELTEEKIVYHYTSPEAFLNIIQGKSVRFSDILYLNDKSEKKFFIKKLVEFCNKNQSQYAHFHDACEELLHRNVEQELIDLSAPVIKYSEEIEKLYKQDRFFVFCACNESDSLNMWNYYVNNGKYQGYSLGINTRQFLKTFDTDAPNHIDGFLVYYGDVLYDEQKQFAEIQHLAEDVEGIFYSNKNNCMTSAMLKIREYIDMEGAFYKSPKFEYEKEYRILISIKNGRIPRKENEGDKYFGKNNKEIIEGFCTKNGLIVPFLKVCLPRDAVARVYTSPIMEYQIAKNSIKELLDANEFRYNNKSVSIYRSAIPIRF